MSIDPLSKGVSLFSEFTNNEKRREQIAFLYDEFSVYYLKIKYFLHKMGALLC